jgi:hypothetical protein
MIGTAVRQGLRRSAGTTYREEIAAAVPVGNCRDRRCTLIRSENRNTDRLLYDRKTAAHKLSISVRSLDYLIAAKQIDTRRIGKKVLIPHGALVRFAQGNHYESPKRLAEVA